MRLVQNVNQMLTIKQGEDNKMANPEWENYQSTESKLGEIITYRHHDAIVSVRKNLKGLHR